MAYLISFRAGKRVVSTRLWPCALEAAAAHVKAQLPTQHEQTGATSATVTCERTGKVVFSYAEQSEASAA